MSSRIDSTFLAEHPLKKYRPLPLVRLAVILVAISAIAVIALAASGSLLNFPQLAQKLSPTADGRMEAAYNGCCCGCINSRSRYCHS